MAEHPNLTIARRLLDGIASGRDPDEVASLFAPDLVFEVQGDDGALPWIGRRTGRDAFVGFVRDQRALTEPIAFEVEDVLAGETRAVIVGRLETRIKATGRVVAGAFAFVLTTADGVVTRFQMLEDSCAVSMAAQR